MLAVPELPEAALPDDGVGDWLREVEERAVPLDRRGGPRTGDADLRNAPARADTSPACAAFTAANRAADWLRELMYGSQPAGTGLVALLFALLSALLFAAFALSTSARQAFQVVIPYRIAIPSFDQRFNSSAFACC